MHKWGDKNFDWNALDNAGRDLNFIFKTFGRIGLHWKEKWGCLRTSTYFFDGSLHSLTHPSYVYSQYPKWLWTFNVYYSRYFFKYTGLLFLIRHWQYIVYTLGYTYICIKYLHIVNEIMHDAENYELLWRGKEIHNKYWKTLGDIEDEKEELEEAE